MKIVNNVKYVSVLLILFTLTSFLHAFSPQEEHFKSEELYDQYLSWRARGNFSRNSGTYLAKDFIRMNVLDPDKRVVSATLDSDNWIVYNMRENISILGDSYNPVDSLHKYMLETFFFRFNTREFMYIDNFVKDNNIKIIDTRKNSFAALWRILSSSRFVPIVIERDSQPGVFLVYYRSDSHFKIIFPDDLPERKVPEEVIVKPKEYYEESPPDNKKRVVVEKQKQRTRKERKDEEGKKDNLVMQRRKPLPSTYDEFYNFYDDSVPVSASTTLKQFIDENQNKTFKKKILNNKVNNVSDFLKKQFPEHHLNSHGGIHELTVDSFKNMIFGDIAIASVADDDGINIVPVNNFNINGNSIQFDNGETLRIKELNNYEIDMIADKLNYLVMEHRIIGTDLIHFIITSNDVPVTLSLYEKDDRTLYEFNSYSNMLLMLNTFWKTDGAYFSLTDVKKINNYIEIHGTLVVKRENGKVDFAECKFHLNKNFQIDLAIMVLKTNIDF